jgi:hypothetical protein
MSEQRWDELGVTRGHFLKRLVVGAFVAPVVVSFGLDGVASATVGQQCANQTMSNQTVTIDPGDRYPNDKGGGAFARPSYREADSGDGPFKSGGGGSFQFWQRP